MTVTPAVLMAALRLVSSLEAHRLRRLSSCVWLAASRATPSTLAVWQLEQTVLSTTNEWLEVSLSATSLAVVTLAWQPAQESATARWGDGAVRGPK